MDSFRIRADERAHGDAVTGKVGNRRIGHPHHGVNL
jgi:hypothetical protein